MGVLSSKRINIKKLPLRLNGKVKDNVFKRYTRVKYLLRVKHWRGRDVHSPFTYHLVREALMLHGKNRDMVIDDRLKSLLEAAGMPHPRACRVCRVYSYLKFESYAIGADNYKDEDMLIITETLTAEAFDKLKAHIESLDKRVCVVITSIYDSTEQHSVWHHIIRSCDAVSIDLYHLAFVVFDKYISKQVYKMRV